MPDRAARPGGEGVRRRRPRRATRRSARRSRTSCASASASTNIRAWSSSSTELPKTPAGKVNRKVLRDREQAITQSEAMQAKEGTSCSIPPKPISQDHRGGPRRAAQAHRRQDRRDRRAVVLRGDARQHPPLRARHRRRQSAVVRSRTTPRRRSYGGIDRAAELPVRDQPHHLRLCRRPARRPRHVVGRGLELAQAGQPQRRDLDRGLAEGPDRAPDPLRRPRDPADLPRRFLQPAGRPGRRAPTAGASAPSATTRASRAPSTRRCKARAAAPLHRRRSWPTPTSSTPRRRSAARRRATGRT